MSPEAQRIAIAEACSVKCEQCNNTGIVKKFGQEEYARIREIHDIWKKKWPEQEPDLKCSHHDLPDYLIDLNAMHEAEKVLSENQKCAYLVNLYRANPEWTYDWSIGFSTAAQRGEAFLKTIGKWVYD